MSIRDKSGNLQARHAFPAYRVYVYGINVTEDVLNVDIGYNTGRAPNTCSITLANDLDKYILTTPDGSHLLRFVSIFGNNENSPIVAAIQAKENALYEDVGLDDEMIQRLNVSVGPSDIDNEILRRVEGIRFEAKRRVLRSKVTVRSPGVEQPDIAGKFGGVNVRQYTSDAYRYPFQAEDPIFHANDPVRVWKRDPFNPRRWYHAFSG